MRIQEQSTGRWKTVLSSSWFKISDILKCWDTWSLILLAGNIIRFRLWCDTWTMLILIEAVTQTVVILVLRLFILHVQPTVIIVVPPRIATIRLWQWWEYKNRALDAEKQCWAVLEDIWNLKVMGHLKFDFVSWEYHTIPPMMRHLNHANSDWSSDVDCCHPGPEAIHFTCATHCHHRSATTNCHY